MTLDPVETNSEHYTVVFENDRVRVLGYTDQPGDRTTLELKAAPGVEAGDRQLGPA